jgi:D-alanyl-D-alanine carboxypeptidase/D-alanyl-D-alanine-endopeptidase (penicillin-binding protein 4)
MIIFNMARSSLYKIYGLIFFILLYPGIMLHASGGKPYEEMINCLVENGGYAATKNGRHIFSHNEKIEFIPASIWKLATTLAALETLGEDYHFKTEFFQDKAHNLYIKGYGDPSLVSEEIDNIIKALKKSGVSEINNIYLDNSQFDIPQITPGVSESLNPYDVINSPIAVNFNTIHFKVDKNGTITSAENQTPTLSIMKALGRGFKPGKYRINMSKSRRNISRYVEELFRAIQLNNGVRGKGAAAEKITPQELNPLYVHYSSKSLNEVIRGMLYYSSNFTANQIYLTLGAWAYGYPATWEKAGRFMREYLDKNFPGSSKSIKFEEGAGISRNNRVTATAMMDLLERFRPYADLLPLEKGRYIKSGTMNGIYCYAGYFNDKGKLDTFVVILNQKRNNRDRVLDLMEKWYRGIP